MTAMVEYGTWDGFRGGRKASAHIFTAPSDAAARDHVVARLRHYLEDAAREAYEAGVIAAGGMTLEDVAREAYEAGFAAGVGLAGAVLADPVPMLPGGHPPADEEV